MDIPKQAIVVAAGESSRFWPLNEGIHKSQFRLLGKPLLYWTIKGLKDAGVTDIAVITQQNSSIPEMLSAYGLEGLTYFEQAKPLGTGNALYQAKDFVKGPFFAVWPNKITADEIVQAMQQKTEDEQAEIVLCGAETEMPWDYGVVRFQEDRVTEIVENPKQGQEPSLIKAIGLYLLPGDFFSFYEKVTHNEADLIDAVNLVLQERKGSLVELPRDVPALKYPWELFSLLDTLFASSHFVPSVSSTAIIGENVVIAGEVFIGENAVVKANTIIEGPAYIGEGCEVGYSNVLRGPIALEKGVKTGAFFEAKHSVIGANTHVHSGYIGDSIFGTDCRVGAGFTTANKRLDRQNISTLVKGKKVDTQYASLGIIVGNRAKFGVHVRTMPGVFIGSDCIVGPGVTLFESLPDGKTKKDH